MLIFANMQEKGGGQEKCSACVVQPAGTVHSQKPAVVEHSEIVTCSSRSVDTSSTGLLAMSCYTDTHFCYARMNREKKRF